nr:hypothetical protein [Actinoplanes sp. ATCC 53533]
MYAPDRPDSSRSHRSGRIRNAAGSKNTASVPARNGTATVASRPMSWNSGSQFTPVIRSRAPISRSPICVAFAVRFPWVISTPAGVRVDPDEYCR